MHPLLLALLLGVAVNSGAHAQSVSVFGIVDVAAEHVTRVGPGGSGLSRMPSLTGSVPSRIGLRGTEDLGGALRAVFTLEQGYTPDMGTLSQGARAWGRQAFVGLSGPAGLVSFGRQYTMLYWSILESDVLGPAIYGTGSLDAYIPNARADNAVAWRGTFGRWMLGATYSLGRDAVNAGSPAGTNCPGELAGDAAACRERSVLVKYDSPAWGAALAWDEIRGGPGAFAGLTHSGLKDTRLSANGYGKWGGLKATLGLIRRNNGASAATPRSDFWYLGAAYAVTPSLTFDGEWLRLRFENSKDQARLLAVRASYSLSKRSVVYATLGTIANAGSLSLSVSAGAGGSNPVVGGAQRGLTAGLRHVF